MASLGGRAGAPSGGSEALGVVEGDALYASRAQHSIKVIKKAI